jgi:PadR family transcriptional regulator PadR
MAVNKELLKGSAQTIVLKMLSRVDMYGYQIAQELDRISDGQFHLTEGALYPLLHTLEVDSAVDAYWGEGQGARRRKFYHITEKGRRLLQKKTEEWAIFRSGMDLVLTAECELLSIA